MESLAPVCTAWPAGYPLSAQISMPTTSSSASPLLARCPNSMSVAVCAARGITVPLQSGQCAPHPAPEPVARTNAPQLTTPRL